MGSRPGAGGGSAHHVQAEQDLLQEAGGLRLPCVGLLQHGGQQHGGGGGVLQGGEEGGSQQGAGWLDPGDEGETAEGVTQRKRDTIPEEILTRICSFPSIIGCSLYLIKYSYLSPEPIRLTG